MDQISLLKNLLSERAVHKNIVTNFKVTETRLLIELSPEIDEYYQRSDCQFPTRVGYHDHEIIPIQGLGIQGKAVIYQVKRVRLCYTNDNGQFITFVAPMPGIRFDLLVTDEVVDKAMYLMIDQNQSLSAVAKELFDLYQVNTSTSALERWKTKEADKLPSIGEMIQLLHKKKDYSSPSG